MGNKYLISGFVGGNNMGDELILQSIIYTIRKADEDADFTVLSLNPKETLKYNDVNAIYWAGLSSKLILRERDVLLDVIKAVKNSDKVIIGGGGLLQDVHWSGTIPRHLVIALIAQFYNIPVIYFSMGVGPIRRKMSRYFTKLISNDVNYITVRDIESKNYLKDIGVNKTKVKVTADPVLVFSDIINKVQNSNSKIKKRKIGVSIRKFKFNNKLKLELAKALDYIIDNFNSEIHLIPMNKIADCELCTEISELMDNKINIFSEYKSPIDIVKKISTMDFMISMRLHGLIVAASYGIPGIGLVYDPKVSNFLNSLGLSKFSIPLNNFNFNVIINKFSVMLNDEERIKVKIKTNVHESKKVLISNVKQIVELKNEKVKKRNIVRNIYKMFISMLPQGLEKLKSIFVKF